MWSALLYLGRLTGHLAALSVFLCETLPAVCSTTCLSPVSAVTSFRKRPQSESSTSCPCASLPPEGKGVIIAVIIICILLLAILGSVLYFLYKKGKICGRSGKQDLWVPHDRWFSPFSWHQLTFKVLLPAQQEVKCWFYSPRIHRKSLENVTFKKSSSFRSVFCFCNFWALNVVLAPKRIPRRTTLLWRWRATTQRKPCCSGSTAKSSPSAIR